MGRFFSACRQYADGNDLKEFVLRRYGSAYDVIMRMEIDEFIDFINEAKKTQKDERLYQLWAANFTKWKPEYQNFPAFRDMMTGANIDRRSNEEILAEVAEIEKELELINGDVTV